MTSGKLCVVLADESFYASHPRSYLMRGSPPRPRGCWPLCWEGKSSRTARITSRAIVFHFEDVWTPAMSEIIWPQTIFCFRFPNFRLQDRVNFVTTCVSISGPATCFFVAGHVYLSKIVFICKLKIKIARLRPAATAIYSILCLEFIQLCIVFHA